MSEPTPGDIAPQLDTETAPPAPAVNTLLKTVLPAKQRVETGPDFLFGWILRHFALGLVLFTSGYFVWPEWFFAAFGTRTRIEVIQPEKPLFDRETGLLMNAKFGFRDDRGTLRLVAQKSITYEYVWRDKQSLTLDSLTAKDVEYVRGHPWLWRSIRPDSRIRRPVDRPQAHYFFFALVAVNMACLAYYSAKILLRLMRYRRPQAFQRYNWNNTD